MGYTKQKSKLNIEISKTLSFILWMFACF